MRAQTSLGRFLSRRKGIRRGPRRARNCGSPRRLRRRRSNYRERLNLSTWPLPLFLRSPPLPPFDEGGREETELKQSWARKQGSEEEEEQDCLSAASVVAHKHEPPPHSLSTLHLQAKKERALSPSQVTHSLTLSLFIPFIGDAVEMRIRVIKASSYYKRIRGTTLPSPLPPNWRLNQQPPSESHCAHSGVFTKPPRSRHFARGKKDG